MLPYPAIEIKRRGRGLHVNVEPGSHFSLSLDVLVSGELDGLIQVQRDVIQFGNIYAEIRYWDRPHAVLLCLCIAKPKWWEDDHD